MVVRRESKAQSAVEYLMTYGWMLLVVAIVGGAIFSMVGDQSIESVQGFDSNEIQVNEFGMTPSSLQMNLEAFGADSIVLKEVKLTDSSSTIDILLDQRIRTGDNQVLNLPHFQGANNQNNIQVELVYDTGNLENISTSGTITGDLELDKNLVSYWTLSEKQANSTHIFDVSGNNNHGEITGQEFVSEGVVDDSMLFDGENAVHVKKGDMDFTESLTISMWFKINDTYDPSSDRWGLIGQSSTSDEFQYEAYEGNLNLRFGETEDSYGITSFHNMGLKGNWQHTVITRQYNSDGSGTVTQYWNGQKIDELDYTGVEIDEIEKDVRIGASLGARVFNGNLAEVMLFDRALSEKEAKSLYNAPGLSN